MYYGDALGADQSFAIGNAQIAVIQYNNDGRADFAANPTNGQPLPTYAQALPQFCSSNAAAFADWRARNFTGAAPCLLRAVQEFVGPPEFVHLPRTFQTSIGFQHQIGGTMAVEVDYVYSKGSNEKDVVDNINLAFNPATGANYPSTDRARLPFPDWGVVSMNTHLGRSAYHGLQTGLTKRFSGRWQASATYTLAGLWNADTQPFSGLQPVPFETQPDLGGEWGLSADDQRHRAVFNGIWQVGPRLSGERAAFPRRRHPAGQHLRRRSAQHRRAAGGRRPPAPGRHDRPAQSLIAPAQNRTDLRLQQRIPLGGRTSIDGIAEIFNIFNRPNYGIGTQESTPSQYLKPITAQTRTMQFGFRLTF